MRAVSTAFFESVLTIWIVAQPQPSLTTEYTPRERGTLTKQSSSTPQPASQAQTPLPPVAATPGTTEKLAAEGEKQESKDAGPDPNTLPPATAPPSHPSINPSAPGIFDGRSILELDLNALADKPWRRPGSDISDWFNYGFDEISWEAYCYRRRELSDLAGMLKNNVVVRASSSYTALICTLNLGIHRTLLASPRTSSSLFRRRSARWSWQGPRP